MLFIRCKQSLAWLLSLALFNPLALASSPSQITHDPIALIAAGQRLDLAVTISDPIGVDLVRAYFKHQSGSQYLFVALTSSDGRQFSGQLPAASTPHSSLQYLLLVKNRANQVYKTQTFEVGIVGAVARTMSSQPLQVYTELAEAPQSIPGFTDNLSLDVVESTAKYGLVAQLYGGADAGSAAAITGSGNAGTVTAASSQTQVAAGSGVGSGTSATPAATTATTTSAATTATTAAAGISATTVAIGAAVVGGVAAAAGGGGGGDDSSPPPPTAQTNYNGVYSVEMTGSLADNTAGDCFSGAQLRFSNVNLAVSGSTLTLDFGTGTMSGTISGTNIAIQSGTLAIVPGTAGFASTDQLGWDAFQASFSSETSFSSADFMLRSYETGVMECGYNANLSGNR